MTKLLTAAALAAMLAHAGAEAADPENTLLLELRTGTTVIEMRPDLAPNHVARIKELTRQGFYDGLKFHRVIKGFMAQTGDPQGNGSGGTGQKLQAEFSREPFKRGTVGMARAQDPNSGDSQWFIMLDRSAHLDNKYTVWGEVIEGMKHVDRIKKGERALNGIVQNPDRIISLKVQADTQ